MTSAARSPLHRTVLKKHTARKRRLRDIMEKDRLTRFLEAEAAGRWLGRSGLETASVQAKTRSEYVRRVKKFLIWMQVDRLSELKRDVIDVGLVKWFDKLFLESAATGEDAIKTIAGLLYLCPEFKVSGGFPRASRAAKGWKLLRPSRSRPPLPWIGLLAIIGAAAWRGRRDIALALLLMFQGYLRPTELTSLRRRQLVSPVPHLGTIGKCWGLVLGDFELGRRNKTGEFDESVRFDWEGFEWIGALLQELKNGDPNGKVWLFDLGVLRREFRAAVALSGTALLDPQLYSLRHGGASHDALSGRRVLRDIKKRGRWRSDASVRRYEKATLAQREAGRLAGDVTEFGKRIEMELEDILCGRVRPPFPPRAPRRQMT